MVNHIYSWVQPRFSSLCGALYVVHASWTVQCCLRKKYIYVCCYYRQGFISEMERAEGGHTRFISFPPNRHTIQRVKHSRCMTILFICKYNKHLYQPRRRKKRNELLPFHRKKEMKVLAKKRKEMKERPLKKEKWKKARTGPTNLPDPKREEGRGNFGPLL